METNPDECPPAPNHHSHNGAASTQELFDVVPGGWDRICEILHRKLGEDNFSRCFAGTSARVTGGGRLVISVPNPIHQLWIESNFQGVLNDAAAEVLGTAARIEFSVALESAQPFSKDAAPQDVKAARVVGTRQGEPRNQAPSGIPEPVSERALIEAGLNPKYNFDSFVVGANCSYSAAVARAVAEKPGRIYNPLFLHGATGLGKTHLMQAIGQEVLMRKKRAVVRYVTSEQFTNEFVEAIKKQNFTLFRQKYRKVDLLLIDDVHFFGGKDSTQEEFFHTFNELFNNARQIVLASDRPPAEMKNLEARLVSRFDWGLTTQIQTPDLETRTAILRHKVAGFNVTLAPWIIEFIAQRVRTNVRKLEGALMRVASRVSLEGDIPNEAALAAFLDDVIEDEPAKSVTVDRVQRAVATQYDLRVSDLTGPRRPKNIAEARQVAMYLTRQMVKLPLIQIGEEFGGRDHGTVIHACKVVSKRMHQKDDFRIMVDRLSAKLLEA
ncbi:MAG TPA: chromosomal replication initiator protein DnaA [Verrucomicrobiales bacterium]|nr:chromosomal replication initiator protein DnaA [Verrucomicrobiales bacterium]